MKQLVIKQEDICKVGDIEYFKFQYDYRILRDINADLSKNDKYTLEMIAKKCELDYKGLKNLVVWF